MRLKKLVRFNPMQPYKYQWVQSAITVVWPGNRANELVFNVLSKRTVESKLMMVSTYYRPSWEECHTSLRSTDLISLLFFSMEINASSDRKWLLNKIAAISTKNCSFYWSTPMSITSKQPNHLTANFSWAGCLYMIKLIQQEQSRQHFFAQGLTV